MVLYLLSDGDGGINDQQRRQQQQQQRYSDSKAPMVMLMRRWSRLALMSWNHAPLPRFRLNILVCSRVGLPDHRSAGSGGLIFNQGYALCGSAASGLCPAAPPPPGFSFAAPPPKLCLDPQHINSRAFPRFFAHCLMSVSSPSSSINGCMLVLCFAFL